MGLCSSESNIGADTASSWDEIDESFTDRSMTEEINGKKAIVVSGPQAYKLPGSIGITHLKFCSNEQLSKPLFGSTNTNSDMSQISSQWPGTTAHLVPVTEVTAQLFFGSLEDASNEQKLLELGITHIVSLIGPKHSIEGIKLKHRPMSDHGQTDLKKVITMLWPFIVESQEVGNKLFVHCQSGQNRSATVVLAILMKLKNKPSRLNELYTMVKKKRPIIQINQKYARQLCEMESELFGRISVPKNWMAICAYNMETGTVRFNDEIPSKPFSMDTTRTFKKTKHPIISPLNLLPLKDDAFISDDESLDGSSL